MAYRREAPGRTDVTAEGAKIRAPRMSATRSPSAVQPRVTGESFLRAGLSLGRVLSSMPAIAAATRAGSSPSSVMAASEMAASPVAVSLFAVAVSGGGAALAERRDASLPKIPPDFCGGGSAAASALICATWAVRSSPTLNSASAFVSDKRSVRLGSGEGGGDAGCLTPGKVPKLGLALAGAGAGLALGLGAGFGANGWAGGAATAGADSGALATGCACQTWPHFEQRTLRPSGGNAALTS